MNKPFTIDIKNYQLIPEKNILGSGCFSVVYIVEHKKTKERYAAKVIKEEKEFREVEILANIQHPTIIKFYGYSEISFDNTNCLTLIMDIAARGSLKNYLAEIKKDRNNPDFDNTPLQIILIGISRGMMKLHEMKSMHRDLKIENVLLNEFNYPLITDFGLSKILEDTSPKEQSKSVSSAIITAPEMILGEKYTISVDVYAFGIILYEIITTLQPYDGISMYKIIDGVPKGLRPQIPEKTPKTFKKLIERCWDRDMNNRPTFETIYRSLAFNKKDIMNDEDDFNYYLENVNKSKVFEYIQKIDDHSNEDLYVPFLFSSLKESEASKQEMKKQISTLKSDKEKVSIEKVQLKKSNEDIQSNNGQLATEITQLKRANETAQKEIDRLRIKNKENEQEITNLKTIISDSKSSIKKPIYSEKLRPTSKSQGNFTIVGQPLKDVRTIELHSDNKGLFQYISISLFNQLSGPIQSKIFQDFFRENKDEAQSTQIQELNSLLRAINNLRPPNKKVSNFIEIRINELKDFIPSLLGLKNTLNSICISASATELLYEKNKLGVSSDFVRNTLIHFHDVILEFEYSEPSEHSESLFESLLKLKENLADQINIQLSIYFREIAEVKASIKEHINLVKIGTSPTNERYFSNFQDFENLFEVSFVNSLVDIGKGVFTDCKSLKKITFPESLQAIPNEALKGCLNLSDVFMSDSIKEIGSRAFCDCSSLQKVEIPKSVTVITEDLFRGCKALKEMRLPLGVAIVRSNAFCDCSSLELVDIPASVTEIEKEAFSGCSSLLKLNVPASVTLIGHNALNCHNLKELTLPACFEKRQAIIPIFSKNCNLGYPKSTKVTYH